MVEHGTFLNPFVWGCDAWHMARLLVSIPFCNAHDSADPVEQEHKFEAWLSDIMSSPCAGASGSPLAAIRNLRSAGMHCWMVEKLREHAVGRYHALSRTLRDMAQTRDPSSMTRDDISELWGFGLVSASLFKAYSDPFSGVVVLDAHTLSDMGFPKPECPDDYKASEKEYLKEAFCKREHPTIMGFKMWIDRKHFHGAALDEVHMSMRHAYDYLDSVDWHPSPP